MFRRTTWTSRMAMKRIGAEVLNGVNTIWGYSGNSPKYCYQNGWEALLTISEGRGKTVTSPVMFKIAPQPPHPPTHTKDLTSHFLSNDSLHLHTCGKPDYNHPRLDSNFILQIKYFLNILPYTESSRNVATKENEDRKHFLWCEAFVRNFTILKTHTTENNAASNI